MGIVIEDESGGLMQAYRTEATVGEDGKVTVSNVPFRSGEEVEVIVRPHRRWASEQNPYPLRGTVYSYERPTDPVAEDDWEALR